jgi:hypothetical protein
VENRKAAGEDADMNERLKELAEQAALGFEYDEHSKCFERFAELVRADEREACAVLVEGGNHVHPKAPDAVWAKTIAKLIRARTI